MEAGNCPSTFSCAWHFVTGFEVLRSQHFRLSHSETYSFSLELETSIAIAVETTSTLLSPQIVRNPNVPFIFHSDFDNFDQLFK
jgi:hypothetical protein